MRTNNPMLKNDVFRKANAGGSVMTIGGTVGKTLIMLLLLLGTSVYSYMQVMQNKMNFGVAVGAVVVAFVFALITSFAPRAAFITAPVYAAVEGVFLGTVSGLYTQQFGNYVILQAVLLTISIMLAMLILYATRIIKATDTFRSVVMSATLGVFFMYLIVMILQLFHVPVPFLHDGGTIAIIVSAIVIVIAALNLVLDFHFIESSAKYGSPQYMEWYGAFALMATLVWLYLEILRLVSYFARND
ncbi:Bax inhibitor-1/YccA family protein [Ectobacillus funiculus]|uniref:Bax inhibitor-1/YccA family protein n=1 Tax=Ectobacillus funiculus TaxID=137993 RepID=UPI00101D23A5|nr:Bax inhibitor-1/YccA family protein [Ectobacillus funiculus]